MYGCRLRPQYLDLHPIGRANTQEREISRDGRAIEAYDIATNIDPSTQAWHEAYKYIDLSIGI